VSPGAVVVMPSSDRYARGEVIEATVANGLDNTIFGEDSQSDCSILLLELKKGGAWQPIPGCEQRRPPVSVAIGSSRGRSVTIDPASPGFAAALGQDAVPLEPGTYRLTFTYSVGQAGGPQAAHSAPFEITA
jgi:hypothetical protein